MKNIVYCLIILGVFSCVQEASVEEEFDLTGYVDPQIGSVHGRWFFYTPAALPLKTWFNLIPPTMHVSTKYTGWSTSNHFNVPT